MTATLDWSYRLLQDQEAAVWRQLGVFRGGFDESAARKVVQGVEDLASLLDRLVDVSLLKIDRSAPGRRFRMLEVIREYAESLLGADERDRAIASHGEYFAELAADQARSMETGQRAAAISALRRDHDNVRFAIANARAEGSSSEIELVANLGSFWFDAGFHAEAREAYAAAIGNGTRPASRELVSAIEQLVQLYSWSGSLDRAYELAAQQTEVAEALDDQWARSRVLATEGILGFITGDYRAAIAAYENMLEVPETHETATAAYVTASLAYLYAWTGDLATAQERFSSAMVHAERLNLDDRDGIAGDYRGWAAFQQGDHAEALLQWQAGEDAYAALGLRPMRADMCQLRGWALLAEGDAEAAAPLLRDSTEEMQQLGLVAYVTRGHMLQAVAEFDTDSKASLLGLADALTDAMEIRRRPVAAWCLWYGASFAAHQGRTDDCKALRQHAESFFDAIPWQLPAGFHGRDAELLDLVDLDVWVPDESLSLEAARAHLIG